ncbi:hypothetical protein [Ekhidna sp.]|uniref:hypothetical protein n=1 Tax=Ekhidna sp. TaxID=2608089 RepID=UPI003CCBE20D
MKNHLKNTLRHLCLLIAFLSFHLSYSNNVTVSNVTLTGQDAASDFTFVQFDITWENSWRVSAGPANWDAVWVFVKYRVGSGDWQHAWLEAATHAAPAGSTITDGLEDPSSGFNATTNPSLGVFIYRDADGSGTINLTGVQLRWNYGENGVDDNDGVDIKVFAIEMVNIPQASFFVGSGGSESGSFTEGDYGGGDPVPLQITSEGALTIGTGTGELYGTSTSGDNTIGATGTLAAEFPKGFDAIYVMKYEISQQGYVDFLNTIDGTQGTARYPGQTANRHGIIVSGGVYSTSTPYIACNFLSWADLAAYLDWSALRPMTELEYEKIARGTLTPEPNEYAWGTTTLVSNAYTLSNAGAIDEGIATNYSAGGNASYDTSDGAIDGPLRNGIFAANGSNTGRETSGASFYGVMELSGNLKERYVSVGRTNGRSFTGLHGDGAIDASGDADVTNWPATTGDGIGERGGDWFEGSSRLRISDRIDAALTIASRVSYYGGRGARVDPN